MGWLLLLRLPPKLLLLRCGAVVLGVAVWLGVVLLELRCVAELPEPKWRLGVVALEFRPRCNVGLLAASVPRLAGALLLLALLLRWLPKLPLRLPPAAGALLRPAVMRVELLPRAPR